MPFNKASDPEVMATSATVSARKTSFPGTGVPGPTKVRQHSWQSEKTVDHPRFML